MVGRFYLLISIENEQELKNIEDSYAEDEISMHYLEEIGDKTC